MIKLWWHKLKNWEYWSVYFIYLPTFFLWIWYAIKYQSIRFYKYSNPGITNGGLYGDSKMSIYKLLPSNLYPKTILVKDKNLDHIAEKLVEMELSFPLIVKPDIGFRGEAVQKVYSIDEITSYAHGINRDFLIQEIINHPNEIGLFYYRLPDQPKGEISGITVKKFLTITGNGKSSLEELLKENPRFELQMAKLKSQMDLSKIPSNKEMVCLVPFGNHSRGTEFLDGKDLISEKLEKTIDSILNKVPGFYYGRLDIRFNTMAELEEGMNFSIIELNGAKSEPTHIYDPKHSFYFGQKEIFRHQFIFGKIIKLNAQQDVNSNVESTVV